MASTSQNSDPNAPTPNTATESSLQSPIGFFDQAMNRAPKIFRWLWGLLAIVGVVFIVISYFTNPAVAVFGGVIVLSIFMVLVVCFGLGKLDDQEKPALVRKHAPILMLALAYPAAGTAVMTLVALFSSAFFNQPIKLGDAIFSKGANARSLPASLLPESFSEYMQEARLEKTKKLLENNVVDFRIKQLFVERSLRADQIQVKVFINEKKQIERIEFWPLVGSFPLFFTAWKTEIQISRKLQQLLS